MPAKNGTATFIRLASAGVALCLLSFTAQYKINSFDKQIKRARDEIATIETEIKVLEAEIARLASISRTKVLAARFLPHFKSATPKDFRRAVDIPLSPEREQ